MFDVKMEFTREDRWVLDGHKMPSLICSTCTGVVSRVIVRTSFTHATLNRIEVFVADVTNIHLQDLSAEQHCTSYGAESGLDNIDEKQLIGRIGYGLKQLGEILEIISVHTCLT